MKILSKAISLSVVGAIAFSGSVLSILEFTEDPALSPTQAKSEAPAYDWTSFIAVGTMH
ncbi:MAG: hypothetical protein ACFB4J_19725 [Elainellaceae cyanobacterium]